MQERKAWMPLLDKDAPSPLFPMGALALTSLLGGLVGGFALLISNAYRLDNPQAARRYYFLGCALLILGVLLALALPDVPGWFFLLAGMAATLLVAETTQHADLRLHRHKLAPQRWLSLSVLVGLAGLVVQLLLALLLGRL